jgi:hypothetical protein
MEVEVNQLTELVDRYFAIWNETDTARRRDLIARTWTETASYLDPAMQGEGYTGIDAMVQGVQHRFAGHTFRQTSAVDSHHDRIRFSWELAPNGGPAIVSGTDFGIVAADGRLHLITGFFDHVPAAAPE